MSSPAYTSTLAQTPPLVPSETVKEKRETALKQPEELLDYVKKLTARLRQENPKHNHAMWAKALTNEMMYRGNQHGRVSDLDGSWRNYKRGKGDPRYTHNLIGGHVDAIVASHVLAKTDLEVIALPSDDADEHTQGKARVANNIIDYYENEILTETFRIRESKMRQFGGGVARYSIWDASAGHQKIQRPVMGEGKMAPPVPSSYTCSVCGESGPLDNALEGQSGQAPQCPYCHSEEISVTKVNAAAMPQVQGYESVPSGDCRTVSVPMYQLDFDRTGSDFYEALWLCWKRRFRPEVIKELFPWWERVKGSDSPDEDDYGQKVDETLRNSAGNTEASFSRKRGGKDESGSPSLIDVEQWWLKPCMYATAPKVQKDVPLGDPKSPSITIPAGSALKEIFPDGLYVMLVNKTPVDFRSESFLDHWVYIPYKVIPSKIEGDGNEDMNEPQREINMIDAGIYMDIRMKSFPPNYYEELYVKNADLVGRPDVNVPVKTLPPNKKIQDVIHTPQPPQLPAHVPQQREWLSQLIQWQSKASGTSTGMTMLAEQTGEKTATGAKLVAQGAAAQRAPENGALTDGDVRTAKIWLKLFHKNAVDARLIPLRGKSSGPETVLYKGSDLSEIDAELIVVARPGSNIPRGPEEKQNDYMNAMALVGGPQGLLELSQAAPQFVKKVEDIFRVEFDVTGFDLDSRQSRIRMDAMTKAVPQALAMAQAMGDGNLAVAIILQSAPIKPKTDNLQANLKWLADWTKQDEGMEAHPILQMAVDARIEEIEAAMQGLMAEKMQQEQALTEPLREQAKADQQEQAAMMAEQEAQSQGAQAEQQNAQQAAQMEQEQASRAQERQAQIEDRMIDEAGKEADHKRQLELEREKQKGAVTLAKMKPKGKSE